MSKKHKTIKPKRNSRATPSPDGDKVAENTNIFSLLVATIAGAWQKVLRMAMHTVRKAKGLPGSDYVQGSSATAAGEIDKFYDRPEDPDI